VRHAENLDPLSLIINADLAELLLIAHHPDESIEQSRKTIEMDPHFALAHNQLAQAFLEKHMFNDASQNCNRQSNSPEVVLCASQIWLEPTLDRTERQKRFAS
jgi:hypothetical protein